MYESIEFNLRLKCQASSLDFQRSWLPPEGLKPILLLKHLGDGVISHDHQLLNFGKHSALDQECLPKAVLKGWSPACGSPGKTRRTSERCGLLGGSQTLQVCPSSVNTCLCPFSSLFSLSYCQVTSAIESLPWMFCALLGLESRNYGLKPLKP